MGSSRTKEQSPLAEPNWAITLLIRDQPALSCIGPTWNGSARKKNWNSFLSTRDKIEIRTHKRNDAHSRRFSTG